MKQKRRVVNIDFIPDKEFHPIFDRISEIVDLKGAFSVVEINERLEETAKDIKRSPFLRRSRANLVGKNLIKLKDAGFGSRVIKEASENPRGKIALTLKHGREKAKKILLERSRRRIGTTRKRSKTKKKRRYR